MKEKTTAWDAIFEDRGHVFTDPHPDLPAVAQHLKDEGLNRVLDLGCGTGRHVVYLARNGFAVHGLDNSPQAIKMSEAWLEKEHLDADVRLQEMTEKLPYADGFFDAVLSVQVIHHADVATIKRIVQEMVRVIKRGGFIFVTVPKLRNQGKSFKEIEPNTFVPLDGAEAGLPHHYFTPGEFREFFTGFEVKDIHLDEIDHYCLSGVKL